MSRGVVIKRPVDQLAIDEDLGTGSEVIPSDCQRLLHISRAGDYWEMIRRRRRDWPGDVGNDECEVLVESRCVAWDSVAGDVCSTHPDDEIPRHAGRNHIGLK